MRRVAPRGHQDGGSQYSQSPLEPVLVNMVPPDLEPPRGYRGRESKGDGIRRLRRRTRGGAVRRQHYSTPGAASEWRMRVLWASPSRPFLVGKGSASLGDRVCLSGVFRRLLASFGKEMGWRGKIEGVTAGSGTLVLSAAGRLWSRKSRRECEAGAFVATSNLAMDRTESSFHACSGFGQAP